MNSNPVLPRLYAGTIKPEEFRHKDHLQAGWECLRSGDVDEPQRLASSLRALAERSGAPERYHATITGAFLALIGSAMKPRQRFEAFLIDNPGLLDRQCLLRHYSREQLERPEARTRFLPPDREPLPPPGWRFAALKLPPPVRHKPPQTDPIAAQERHIRRHKPLS